MYALPIIFTTAASFAIVVFAYVAIEEDWRQGTVAAAVVLVVVIIFGMLLRALHGSNGRDGG
jgi:hypothetical protein